jgi:hypothetical protein
MATFVNALKVNDILVVNEFDAFSYVVVLMEI